MLYSVATLDASDHDDPTRPELVPVIPTAFRYGESTILHLNRCRVARRQETARMQVHDIHGCMELIDSNLVAVDRQGVVHDRGCREVTGLRCEVYNICHFCLTACYESEPAATASEISE